MQKPMDLNKEIDVTRVPRHIAIIMDGNGRWAKKQGQERLFGHTSGVDAVRDTVKACQRLGVKYLTLYTFSTENWNRPKDEVNGLMELMVKTIINELPDLMKNGVRIRTIGDLDGLPKGAHDEMLLAIEQTKKNASLQLILALNYSGKWELTEAMRKIADEIKQNALTVNDISEELIAKHLSTAPFPDPELLIRTSGEFRLSNFLLWQCAYSEFYFTDVLWPDFRGNHLEEAIIEFQQRERRFGKTSEQINMNE